jgi:hypothetical protein
VAHPDNAITQIKNSFFIALCSVDNGILVLTNTCIFENNLDWYTAQIDHIQPIHLCARTIFPGTKV